MSLFIPLIIICILEDLKSCFSSKTRYTYEDSKYNDSKVGKRKINIIRQFSETIEFLYNGNKGINYFNNKSIKVIKRNKEILYDKSNTFLNFKNDIKIQKLFKKIIPVKSEDVKGPFVLRNWLLILVFYVIFLGVIIYLSLIVGIIFPEKSIHTGRPIIYDILSCQIPIISFFVFIIVLFYKFDALTDFIAENYDEDYKDDEIAPSFRMTYELNFATNKGHCIFWFIVGSFLYLLYTFLVRLNQADFDFGFACEVLILDLFFSNILILWVINYGICTLSIYILLIFTFGLYHISQDFQFKFDSLQSASLDLETQNSIKSICFFILTSSFVILSSFTVFYFVTETFFKYLIGVIVLFITILVIVICFFVISLWGWKRKISAQKEDTLEIIRNRRRELTKIVSEKELQNQQIAFNDLVELRFLHKHYIEIYNTKEWFVDVKIIFSFIISLVTFIPEVISYIQTF